ncbi:GroES-like protein [Coccomyxa subellipsoidea C-169]|uniref:GroES-like protein n=1 Tax=Coccomyxa subellipsoidea (strain C-169) TaxID=574566 RepID=I0Z099_COCSC|nr:GroES-like protein [Coccomyxa subellipsoidea C-169]EIE24068.1 GroES-like protein [Coccomyxa subellipsoidea C-169]|eukprot:XP_005648612.1 GroES-like protein [Coccomyxa subellipsoidea C-169]
MAHLACSTSVSCSKNLCNPLPSRSITLPSRAARFQQHAADATILKTQRRGSRFGRVCRAAAVLDAPASLDVTKMEPLGDRILVKPQEEKSVTEGGLMLTGGATKAIQDSYIGKVLAKGSEVDIEVNVGDTVIFSKYNTTDVKVPDGEVMFVAQKSVMAVLS